MGKIFISAITTGLSYYAFLQSSVDEELHHIAGPMAVIFFISFVVSGMFMGVFDMGITTILHCFIADEEMFDGAYAQGSLVQWIDCCQREEADRNESDVK